MFRKSDFIVLLHLVCILCKYLISKMVSHSVKKREFITLKVIQVYGFDENESSESIKIVMVDIYRTGFLKK